MQIAINTKKRTIKFIDFIKMDRSYSEYFAGTTGKDENLEVADSQPLDTESTEKHQWKYGINILLANMDVNPEGSAAEIAENVTKVLVKTVKEGNGEEKAYGPTDSNGEIKVFEGKQITKEGVDEYTITEVNVGKNK